MGGADVIPGVSGGTIAFVTGIYDELLNSIKSVDIAAIRLLLKLKVREFWGKINGNFLIVLLAGLVTAWISLAKLMLYVLKNYQIPTWSFFFGLIVISTLLVLREVKKWKFNSIFLMGLGVVLAYALTLLAPTTTPNSLVFVFLAGAIAICAMILPGISGAFILLLLGKYEFIMTEVFVHYNVGVFFTFSAGCITGLLGFSHVLTWVFKNYHDLAVSILAGFMIGFLNKIWPWRQVLQYYTNSKGEQTVAFDKSIWPGEFMEVTGQNPQILQAILFAALGILLVVGLEKLASSLKTK
jgi:putative membrane protein